MNRRKTPAARPTWALPLALGTLSAMGCTQTDGKLATAAPIAATAQSLYTPPQNLSVAQQGETINTYAQLISNAKVGDTMLAVSGNLSINPGDFIMIIQMQGATFDNSNAATYGTVSSLNGAGSYELALVASVAANAGATSQTVTLAAGCGLKNNYSAAARTQVVSVPSYAEVTVDGSLVPAPWDGNIGGIVALHAQSVLVTGAIDASQAGFSPGAAVATLPPATETGYVSPSSNGQTIGGQKGEGIGGNQNDYDTKLTGSYGRGAPANGGGGGNTSQSGGGGGAGAGNAASWNGQGVMDPTFATAWMLDPFYATANMLASSTGGGRGGYSNSNPGGYGGVDPTTTAPGNPAWGGDDRQDVGGLGGHPAPDSYASALFFGGGGGGGTTNGNYGVPGGGGYGGGLVYLWSDAIAGAVGNGNGGYGGAILANGGPGQDVTGYGGILFGDGEGGDVPAVAIGSGVGAGGTASAGAGGGGGGGAVVLLAGQVTGALQVQAVGGSGGNQQTSGGLGNNTYEADGPGGGGGGGYIAGPQSAMALTPPISVAGGFGGQTDAPAMIKFPDNGATGGHGGTVDTIGAQAAPICAPADLAITVSQSNAKPLPGGMITYAVTVTNNGPLAVTGAAVSGTTGQALTAVSWTCATQLGASAATACAAPSGTGALSTTVSLEPGAQAVYQVNATVAVSDSGAQVYTVKVSPPTGITDPNLANNMASINANITAEADLGVTLALKSTPPFYDLAPITFTVHVTNAGPETANSATLTIPVANGTTVPAVPAGNNWTCGQSATAITCDRPSIAKGETPDLDVTLVPGTGQTAQAIMVTIASSTTDPNLANNTASLSSAVTPQKPALDGGGFGCSATPGQGAPGSAGVGLLALCLLSLASLLRRSQLRRLSPNR